MVGPISGLEPICSLPLVSIRFACISRLEAWAKCASLARVLAKATQTSTKRIVWWPRLACYLSTCCAHLLGLCCCCLWCISQFWFGRCLSPTTTSIFVACKQTQFWFKWWLERQRDQTQLNPNWIEPSNETNETSERASLQNQTNLNCFCFARSLSWMARESEPSKVKTKTNTNTKIEIEIETLGFRFEGWWWLNHRAKWMECTFAVDKSGAKQNWLADQFLGSLHNLKLTSHLTIFIHPKVNSIQFSWIQFSWVQSSSVQSMKSLLFHGKPKVQKNTKTQKHTHTHSTKPKLRNWRIQNITVICITHNTLFTI